MRKDTMIDYWDVFTPEERIKICEIISTKAPVSIGQLALMRANRVNIRLMRCAFDAEHNWTNNNSAQDWWVRLSLAMKLID